MLLNQVWLNTKALEFTTYLLFLYFIDCEIIVLSFELDVSKYSSPGHAGGLGNGRRIGIQIGVAEEAQILGRSSCRVAFGPLQARSGLTVSIDGYIELKGTYWNRLGGLR